MLRYALWLWWVGTRGYRLRPWASPWMRWRIETYSGIPAEQVTCTIFWKFLWTERRSLRDFLEWGVRMKKLEAQRRLESEPRP